MLSDIDLEKGGLDEIPITLTTSRTSDETKFTHDGNYSTAKLPYLHHDGKLLPIEPPTHSDTLSASELALIRPPKRRPRPNQWIRFQVYFTLYRRFFTFIVLFNFIGLMVAASGKWQYPRNYTGAFILGNLLLSILVRNELFARFLYLTLIYLFAKWPPLWFRLAISSTLQHLGGVHSGCAVSGFMWLLFKLILVFVDHATYHPAIAAIGVLTNIAIAVSIASALPWIRDRHHNLFESYHRYVGWIGLVFTWIFTGLVESYDLETHTFDFRGRLVRQQDFWFCLFMTILVVIPWCTVRCVPVQITVPSPKVAVIKFERGMNQGLLARIGHGPVQEFHAFGTISEGPQADCHYLIAGVQGDFTRGLVTNPPTHLWTRQLKFAAISNTSTLYRRGVRVCTGTGIGAGLSTCIQNPNWYLIWLGADTEKTFGPDIAGLINKHLYPHRVTIWDSKKRACRPDTVKLVLDVCKVWEPEVVIITSNLSGSKEIMEGCKGAGIPAFGTLFDFCMFSRSVIFITPDCVFRIYLSTFYCISFSLVAFLCIRIPIIARIWTQFTATSWRCCMRPADILFECRAFIHVLNENLGSL